METEFLAKLFAGVPEVPKQGPPKLLMKIKTLKDEKNKKDEIWNIFEIPRIAEPCDGRARPFYEIIFGQNGGSDFSDFFIIRIKMENAKISDISLDVQKNNISCQTADFYLNLNLPNPVKKEKGVAKWDARKFELEISLEVDVEVKYVTDPNSAYL